METRNVSGDFHNGIYKQKSTKVLFFYVAIFIWVYFRNTTTIITFSGRRKVLLLSCNNEVARLLIDVPLRNNIFLRKVIRFIISLFYVLTYIIFNRIYSYQRTRIFAIIFTTTIVKILFNVRMNISHKKNHNTGDFVTCFWKLNYVPVLCLSHLVRKVRCTL